MKEDKTCKNFSPATYATCSSCTIDGKYTSCSGNKEKCKYILMEKKNEIKRLIDFVEPREERVTELEKENAELKEKDISEYYSHPRTADGHLNRCTILKQKCLCLQGDCKKK